jgi:GNAT superfamily N-acetyltransferase
LSAVEREPSAAIRIRPATEADVGLVHSMILALARYERLADEVTGDPDLLHTWLFGPDRAAEALIAERGEVPLGFALFYRTFSTFDAQPGLWLEDLFVLDEHRGAGVGGALMARLAQLTVERGYTRLEWVALDWNAPALGFYDALGAQLLDDWRVFRLDADGLAQVAAGR